MRRASKSCAAFLVGLLLRHPGFRPGQRQHRGSDLGPGDKPLSGIEVSVVETGARTVTDSSGEFTVADLPPGTYTVLYSFDLLADTEPPVTVAAGAATRIDRNLDWDLAFAETITVVSASRREERITEAPAAITSLPHEEIEREAATGQLPKLLEFTPGVDVTQSGLYDFNLNTRGFNSSLNRRVVTLIDGRDPSVPFLGSQEWAAISFPLDDLARSSWCAARRPPSTAPTPPTASST